MFLSAIKRINIVRRYKKQQKMNSYPFKTEVNYA